MIKSRDELLARMRAGAIVAWHYAARLSNPPVHTLYDVKTGTHEYVHGNAVNAALRRGDIVESLHNHVSGRYILK